MEDQYEIKIINGVNVRFRIRRTDRVCEICKVKFKGSKTANVCSNNCYRKRELNNRRFNNNKKREAILSERGFLVKEKVKTKKVKTNLICKYKNCVICKNEFKMLVANQKCCSKECSKERSKERVRRIRRSGGYRDCITCGNKFKISGYKKNCSKECSEKRNAQNRKKHYHEVIKLRNIKRKYDEESWKG